MPSSIAASSEILELRDPPAVVSVDKREASNLKAEGSGHCCCNLCASSRKSDSTVSIFLFPLSYIPSAYRFPKEAPCDRERQPGPTSLSFREISLFKAEESYPDVPRTASLVSLTTPSNYPNESALDITIATSPSPHFPQVSQTQSITDSIAIHREPPLISLPLANPRERSPSPRIFVQSASTQSNLSLATSIDAAFLAPRPAPAPPVFQGAAQDMSLTFVPLFRRVEERDMISCQICLDEEPLDESVVIQSCGHSFGRECMRSYILSRLDERRFPIPCPCCSAADETGDNPGSE